MYINKKIINKNKIINRINTLKVDILNNSRNRNYLRKISTHIYFINFQVRD